MEETRRVIIDFLKVLQTRKNMQVLFQKVVQTLFVALCLLGILYIGIRLVHYPISMTFITFTVLIGSIAVSLYLSIQQRTTLLEVANYVDDHLQLKERISTSLELIEGNHRDDLVDLQLHDSAEGIATISPQTVTPYIPPLYLKWLPIPLIVIGFSFTIPLQYELPLPLTDVERDAIDSTIDNLTNSLVDIDDQSVRTEIEKTIKQLTKVKDIESAHNHLHNLNRKIQQEKVVYPNDEEITQATNATQSFRNMDTSALTEELSRLTDQNELTPELREALAKLLENFGKTGLNGELGRALDQIQEGVVSQDTLKEIVDVLQKLNQLNQLEALLTESRKDIALASIDNAQSTGEITNSDGTPGQELGKQEMRGIQDVGTPIESSPNNDEITSLDNENSENTPLTGDKTHSLDVSGNELKLDSEIESDNPGDGRVFTGIGEADSIEPTYMSYSNVVLAAHREYATAIKNNRIPVRYRSQIKAYLETIASYNEK